MANLDFILPDGNFAQQLEEQIIPAITALEEKVYLPMQDGAILATRVYSTPNAKAVVCISHGFCEFAEKYQEVIYYFTKAGFAVVICDHRGHGYSTRLLTNRCKVHCENFYTFISDFNCMVEYAKERFAGLPTVLFGHSMGGAISALHLQSYPGCFKGAVLSAPMMQVTCPAPLQVWMYTRKLVKDGYAAEYLGDGDFDGIRQFEGSSCEDEGRYNAWFDKRVADLHYQTYNATAGFMKNALQAQSRVVLRAAQIKDPVMICRAGQDHLVMPFGHELFVKRAPNARLAHFETARHEIFNSNESIRRDYWGQVLDFYEQVLG